MSVDADDIAKQQRMGGREFYREGNAWFEDDGSRSDLSIFDETFSWELEAAAAVTRAKFDAGICLMPGCQEKRDENGDLNYCGKHQPISRPATT